MRITDKILDWLASEQMQGRKPSKIALIPWDEKELRQWTKTLPLVDCEPTGKSKIYGLEILTS